MDVPPEEELGPDTGTISPELALVDPELRAAALAELPLPQWNLSARPHPGGHGDQTPDPRRMRQPLPLDVSPAPRGWRRFLPAAAGALAAAALMLAVLEVPSLAGRDDGDARGSSRNGRLLAWAPASQASQYRVLVMTGARVILDTTTKRTNIRLDLPTGVYQWWVWPVTPGRNETPAVVQSTLEVRAT